MSLPVQFLQFVVAAVVAAVVVRLSHAQLDRNLVQNFYAKRTKRRQKLG